MAHSRPLLFIASFSHLLQASRKLSLLASFSRLHCDTLATLGGAAECSSVQFCRRKSRNWPAQRPPVQVDEWPPSGTNLRSSEPIKREREREARPKSTARSSRLVASYLICQWRAAFWAHSSGADHQLTRSEQEETFARPSLSLSASASSALSGSAPEGPHWSASCNERPLLADLRQRWATGERKAPNCAFRRRPATACLRAATQIAD